MHKPILLLGDPALYQSSDPIQAAELPAVVSVVQDLLDTLLSFRRQYGAGRAIAAPQIGVRKRLIYLYIDEPTAILNPVLTFPTDDMMDVLDDCMSFPGLYVRVRRYRCCIVRYRDLDWNERELSLTDDLSELLQHEYDHLDGVLATMRAIDNQSFVMRSRDTPVASNTGTNR